MDGDTRYLEGLQKETDRDPRDPKRFQRGTDRDPRDPEGFQRNLKGLQQGPLSFPIEFAINTDP